MKIKVIAIVLLFSCLPSLFVGQEKPDQSVNETIDKLASKLPRLKPSTPIESLNQIVIHPEFEIQLVASEPLIRDPGAIAIDESNRMYVCELPEYNAYAAKEAPGEGGAIKLLTDKDGDGKYDSATTFLSDIPYPTAIACWDGGVFIGSSPDIIYAKDTDSDGIADVRKVVFTGFGSDKAGEGHLNSFRWGLDNSIHISTNLTGGEVKSLIIDGQATESVRGRGLIFDPRNLGEFELTTGGGQHGMSMDNWGRKYVCSNSVPAQMLMFDDRYLARNPNLKSLNAAINIAPDGKFTQLYRISKAEPWRELRTMLRRTKQFAGSDEGGKPFGFFTGATGITIYRGDAWPEEFQGNLIVGDVANNLVYRAKLEQDGLRVIAHRADEGKEFLASRDLWFRPVQFENAPDGCLYVLDISRELIEGAAFLPPEFLKYLDPVSGNDRGRIYRIAPKGFKTRSIENLGALSTNDLVQFVDHPNGWHRDTAMRLLYTRQDLTAVGSLRELASGKSVQTIHGQYAALYVLQGLNSVDESSVVSCLNSDSALVRFHALKVAEPFLKSSAAIADAAIKLTSDSDMRVKYQLAYSIGEARSAGRNTVLASLLTQHGDDAYMQLAILSSLSDGMGDLFVSLVDDDGFLKQGNSIEILSQLSSQIGAANRPSEVALVVRSLEILKEKNGADAPSRVVEALVSQQQGKERDALLAAAGGGASELITKLVTESKQRAVNVGLDSNVRVDAIRSLGLARFESVSNELESLLDLKESFEIQASVIDTLAKFDDTSVAELLIDRWPAFGPSLRSRAVEVLLSRDRFTHMMLDAIEGKEIATGEIDPLRIQLLRQHPKKEVAERATMVFANANVSKRDAVVKQYQTSLELEGSHERGKAVFKKNCSACHRLQEVGNSIGADLNGIRNRGLPSVLLNILDPNREVKPKYLTYIIIDEDGRSTTGMITSESANSITVRRPDGTETVMLRKDIQAMKSTGLSFMPEGLEKQITEMQMADLLAYLDSLR